MKKILTIVLALIVCALPVLACAEGNWIVDAAKAGRKLTAELSISTAYEPLSMLDGAKITLEGQADPFLLRAVTTKGETVIDDLSIGANAAGDAWYLSSAMAGKTLGFRAGDLAAMAEQILDSLVGTGIVDEADIHEEVAEQFEETAEEIYDTIAEQETLEQDLDLTYILAAIMSLRDCITITDCEDFSVKTIADFLPAAYANKDDKFVDQEALAAYTAAIESGADEKVSMLATIVLTEDDVRGLLDCLLATIAANPGLDAMIGIPMDKFAEAQDVILSSMTQDLTIVVALDEEATPVFSTVGYSIGTEEGNIDFMVDAINIADDDKNIVALKATVTDPYSLEDVVDEEKTIEAHEVVSFIDVKLANNNLFSFILGDSASPNHLTVMSNMDIVENSDARKEVNGKLDIALESDDGLNLIKFTENAVMTRNGEDFDLTDVFSYIDNETGDALASLNFKLFSGETTEINADAAVYPVELDEDDQVNLIGEMLDNAITRIDELASASVVEEAPAGEVVEEAPAAEAAEVPAE